MIFLKKTCTNCGNDSIKDSAAFEVVAAFLERANRRLWITILVLIGLLLATNIGWLVYESQFEVVESWEITQENENGYNNYIGNDGDIYYGETDDQKDSATGS